MTNETVNPQSVPVSCDTFEELASPMLDGEVDGAMLVALEAHRSSCAECAALLSDLGTIRREAGSLPILSPTVDLWSGIAERIAVPVVRLPAAPAGGGGVAATRRGGAPVWFRRPWMAAAAAVLLVATSAGITYRLVAPGSAGPAPASTLTAAVTPSVDEPVPATPGTTDSAAGSRTAPVERMRPARGATTSQTRLAADQPRRAGAPDVAAAYTPELDRMRILLDQRRTSLDTGTVRVLETNLAIIDRAIQESRAALARDPASALLNRQLSDALGEKLELMRTAVQLSSGDD